MRSRLSFTVLLISVAGAACLKPWSGEGTYRCNADETCPRDFTCDDGLCCKVDGTPACPTLPNTNGTCPGDGTPKVYFRDEDGDLDGNEKISRVFCRAPLNPGWVLTSTDCDDLDKTINLQSVEVCNGKDDNCNRQLDEGLPNLRPFYPDEDGDGHGVVDGGVMACAAPPGFVEELGDCDAFDPSKFQGAPELCNNLDDDCDGRTDDQEDSPFQDSNTDRFPCTVSNASGVCSAGLFRCVTSQPGQVVRECRSVATPSREVCDGLDNDCANGVDDRPGCGGPRSLINTAGVTYRAQRLTSSAQLMSTCQANLAGTAEAVSSTGATWTGGAAGYHVWSIEAPPGVLWDLSRAESVLRLKFGATFNATTATGGAWGDPGAGAGFNPVIYLCGQNDTDFIRYRITSVANAFKLNDTAFDQLMPLNNSSPTWIVGIGSGFDTSRVRRIEVLLFTQTSGFTVTFDPATGMLP